MKIDAQTPAIISGAASGLGAATARHLAALGAPVAILDINETDGTALADEISGVFVRTDVTDAASVAAALAAARAALGPARLAISCAGIAPGQRTVTRDGTPHDTALFQRTMDINVMGTFHLATQAAAAMAPLDPLTPDGERGVIVNTASIAAYEAQIGQIAYGASKGAVAAMTLPMARDMSKSGIRVCAIAPGLFRTPMVAGLPPEVQDSLGAAVPFPARLGDPAEFARLVAHIAENSMLNGETIRLDGAIRLSPK